MTAMEIPGYEQTTRIGNREYMKFNLSNPHWNYSYSLRIYYDTGDYVMVCPDIPVQFGGTRNDLTSTSKNDKFLTPIVRTWLTFSYFRFDWCRLNL